MKQGFLLLLCSFVLAPTYAKVKTNTDDCTNAQSNTSYVMSHAKRALKSDNFDHQTYYAERSLKAIEKTKGFLSNCNCNGASDPAYEATKSLKLAIDPKDWDEGRYYTKKAIEHIENLMIAMDNCASGSILPTEVQGSDLDETQNQLLAKQRELEAKQAALQKEQELLAQEVAKQKRLAEATAAKRAEELEKQYAYKTKVELALTQYERAIRNLITAIECQDAKAIILENYKRLKSDLAKEGFQDTKNHYKEKALNITEQLLQQLSNCNQ